MKNLTLTFLSLLLVSSFITSAQEKKEVDNQKTKQVSDIYNFKEEISEYLQISQIENTGNSIANGNRQNNRNIAIIQQVGNNNFALTNTASNRSNVQYLQTGDDNSILSVNRASNVRERVAQRGVSNSILHLSLRNLNTSNLNVIQRGNNLKFEKFGSNAQTNGLKFRMRGNNQTLIVRSF